MSKAASLSSHSIYRFSETTPLVSRNSNLYWVKVTSLGCNSQLLRLLLAALPTNGRERRKCASAVRWGQSRIWVRDGAGPDPRTLECANGSNRISPPIRLDCRPYASSNSGKLFRTFAFDTCRDPRLHSAASSMQVLNSISLA